MLKKIAFLAALLLPFIAFAQIPVVQITEPEPFRPGYRGYVEAGWGAGQLGGPTYLYRQWVSDCATTHGYQITPYWFVGGGISWYRCYDDFENFFPVYAAARLTLDNLPVRPFAEGRVGLIAFNSEWTKNVQKPYLSGSLGIDLGPSRRAQLGGRLTLFGTHDNSYSFNATLYVAYVFGE